MPFTYVNGVLTCHGVRLEDIASAVGTPVYVYSAQDILRRYQEYREGLAGLPHEICYAVKANSNLSVLRLLAQAGSGFDIVSGGELFRVLRAGGDPRKVVFSGVGKTEAELQYALECGIHSFNCESEAEAELLDCIAGRLKRKARIALRVNPDVDASTHPYISTGLREHKFGVDAADIPRVYQACLRMPNLLPESISCHIGSQLLDPQPLLEALDRMLELISELRAAGVPIRRLDLGGGLGIAYRPEERPPAIGEVARALRRRLQGQELELVLEPGRSIVGDAGVLITRVLYRKTTNAKHFVVVDAAMNDLIRPALYLSHHEIIPLEQAPEGKSILADVVGPVCETGDFLARNRELADVAPGALLAVLAAGAYGFVQSSNYNSRPRAAEVMISDGRWRIIRQRETYEDLIRGE